MPSARAKVLSSRLPAPRPVRDVRALVRSNGTMTCTGQGRQWVRSGRGTPRWLLGESGEVLRSALSHMRAGSGMLHPTINLSRSVPWRLQHERDNFVDWTHKKESRSSLLTLPYFATPTYAAGRPRTAHRAPRRAGHTLCCLYQYTHTGPRADPRPRRAQGRWGARALTFRLCFLFV